MRTIITSFILACTLVAHGQPSAKAEFEVASIKANAPQTGFHVPAEAVSGGPGTDDPGMFRCSRCSLATLIVKAFRLQPYQLPGRTALTGNTYDILAKIPAGATEDQFAAMLQSLLVERFGLTWHFEEKKMKGYRLVVAKNGPKMKESGGASASPGGDPHRSGPESHTHNGVAVFGSSASYNAVNQTIGDLVRVLSDQVGAPVNDETRLAGKYDFSFRWSGSGASHAGDHSDGAFSGGAGHAWHDGGGGTASGAAADASGPTLFDALQQQLGLRLAPAEEAVARLFIIDHVAQRPTEN